MIEEDLLRAARAGDRRALEALTSPLYLPVRALAARLLGGAQDAADVAQETFARVLANLADFTPRKRFAAWVLTIAANLCRDRLRRRGRLKPLEDAPVELAPEGLAIGREDRERVLRAAEELPFDLKAVAVMTFQNGLAPVEIAEGLGVTVNAVRIRLYRAIHALRAALKEKP